MEPELLRDLGLGEPERLPRIAQPYCDLGARTLHFKTPPVGVDLKV
jgi:hypothetical protein